ncbi:MAG: hypothetical protein AB8B85_05485 [Paracoccaceae bacterium]
MVCENLLSDDLIPDEGGDISGVSLAGTILTITVVTGGSFTVDLASIVGDVRVTSGTYNAGTQAIDFTMSDASSFSVPVASLLPVSTDATLDGDGSATALSVAVSADALNIVTTGTDGKVYATVPFAAALTAATDAVGDGGTANAAARSDHRHAAQAPSTDADNILSTGADGLHKLARINVSEYTKVSYGSTTAIANDRILMKSGGTCMIPGLGASQDDAILITADNASVTVSVAAATLTINGGVSFTVVAGDTYLFALEGANWRPIQRGGDRTRFMQNQIVP